ncbi:g7404 [Coccomyxa viridis]|uniref:Oxidation resistance protein 1 n=1 Tax=Coccomyxa viridis TaxID=1274662 RepID=A0ABP1FXS2_9CHLO
MGCAHPGRQTDEAYGDFVVTNWNAGQEKGHIVHRESDSAASSAPRKDGAHILSSWTAQEGSDVSCSTVQEEEIPSTLEPTPLVPGNYLPTMSEESSMLSDDDVRALAMAVPFRHRWRHWRLLYSTARDGISLQTLYRRAPESGASVLVVRDTQQHIFGCFTSESWRVAPRYYGTGESFVFQTQPKAQMWAWHQRRMALARNDFFQFGRPDSLALGGAPQYALYLDGDLQFGSSGTSDTFGSPCLASNAEFEIGRVELWGLV